MGSGRTDPGESKIGFGKGLFEVWFLRQFSFVIVLCLRGDKLLAKRYFKRPYFVNVRLIPQTFPVIFFHMLVGSDCNWGKLSFAFMPTCGS